MTRRKKYVTRNEAAEILEVDPQSISNYAQRGFLSTVRSKTNDFTYYIREEVEALLPDIEEISNQEQAIAEYKRVLEEELQRLQEALSQERARMNSSTLRSSYTKQLIEDCYCILEATQDSQPARILLRLLSGVDTQTVCEEYEMSPYLLSKECKKALKAFSLLPDYEQMCLQDDKLKSELQSLLTSYNLLCEQYEALASMHRELVEKYEKHKIKT